MNEVKATVKGAVKELFGIEVDPEISRPEEQFGDFATNVAMQLAPKLSKSPREIADSLASKIAGYGYYEKVDVAGPGFLNITLKDKDIWIMAASATNLVKPLEGQEILVEFGDPNPFKEMHIGHLYSYIVGDSISRLLEANGATVRRLSYHGDVGMHVAKAIYGLQQLKKGQGEGVSTDELEEYLNQAYSYGAKKYEEDTVAKQEIEAINRHVYQQDDEEITNLHQSGRELSFKYFDKILGLLSISNDHRYLESESQEPGLALVEANKGRVFKDSQGAVIYDGEKAGLHTRVFITSQGLPTYETKDLGLTELKNKDYPAASRSIIITANEQSEYFKVMLAALAEINDALAKKTTHLSHGFLSLSSGKMSSRTGNVYAAMQLLLEVKKAVHEQYADSDVKKEVTLAAVKYAFLKHRLGSDIVLDINESISLEGNSGPYLQYAHARANGILQKVKEGPVDDLQPQERTLVRKIGEYPEVVAKATAELMPHHVATYLYELAQTFNRFYEANRVVGDPRESTRASLVKAYSSTLENGLGLLNITAPERV